MVIAISVVVIIIAVCVLVFLYLIAPSIKKREEVFGFCEHFYAHRGLFDNKSSAPENSLFAFNLAVEYGVGIELDIMKTKDDELVVIHDNNIRRVAGFNKNVTDMIYSETQEYTLFDSDEKIPKFSEVLELVDGQVPLLVEIKHQNDIELVCELVAKMLDDYQGKYFVQSFDPFAVKWFKKNRPDIIRGQLAHNYLKDKSGTYTDKLGGFAMTNLLTNFIGRPDFISYDEKNRNNLGLKIVKMLYDVPCFGWTIKSQEMLDGATDIFEGFIFEGFLPEEKKIL